LALIGTYGLVSLVAMFPIISQASMRYYIISFFLAFVFLGVWLEFLVLKLKGGLKKTMPLILVIIIAFSQLYIIKEVASAHIQGGASNVDYAIWGEVEDMMKYISENINPDEDVYIAGRHYYFSRFYKPFLYFASQYGITIQRGDKEKNIKPGAQVIYVQGATSDKKIKESIFKGRTVKNYKIFKNVSIINYGRY
jgi:hypothetical protein